MNSNDRAALGLSAPTGVLLCGPPGCGKQLVAKAATESGASFVSSKAPPVMFHSTGATYAVAIEIHCMQSAQ